MAKLGLDYMYTVVSLSLLESTTIHHTSSCFSLGILQEFTEACIQSLERNLDEACKKLHTNNDLIDCSSTTAVLLTCKTCSGPSSRFNHSSPTLKRAPPSPKNHLQKESFL